MAEVSEDAHDVSDEDYIEVTVLSTGKTLEYVVPSFPVYKVTLWEMKLQWEEADGTIHAFDGFARECGLIKGRTTPAMAKILFNYDSAFMIEVDNYVLTIIYIIYIVQIKSLAFVQYNLKV